MRPLENLLVTGGAGFIGSAFIRYLLRLPTFCGKIINLDLLTYAGCLDNLREVEHSPRYRLVRGDVNDLSLVKTILQQEQIDAIVHFAAETHVDRSIVSALPFFQTNVLGTLALLEAVRSHPHVHFHHVSTDEVYGSLEEEGAFHEASLYNPNSPYAASKASSDHLVRAFAHTYGLSVTLSHCSNNYGIGQYPEKFIPLMILNCLSEKTLPVYGNGRNVRDWLYVEDHVEALWTILHFGQQGHTYDIGGGTESSNLDLLHLLIDLIADETGKPSTVYRSLIRFVEDRPGHDFRYAIDASKIERELGWRPKTVLREGLSRSIRWYMS
ncbi:MAG: dTDP-glucose 4,6-dehydratase [Chlamydiia bacterium]|nr:dTDP-glucose 4,6-dehydratase [Chlamydiia bacterium]